MKKLDYTYCRAAPVMEWMANKWALATLLQIEACGGKNCRFGDLFRRIPHLSEKVLASTLDYLEHEGLVKRAEYEGHPPRVEYALTPLAVSFLREISYVVEWGQLHYDDIMKAREHPAGR